MAIFQNGFEEGTLVPPWSATDGYAPSIVSTPVHSGTKAMRCTNEGGVVYNFTGSAGAKYARVYVYFSSLPSSGGELEVIRLGTWTTRAMVANVSGKIVWRLGDDYGNNFDASTGPVINTWYCVELKVSQSSADTDILYINGVQVASGTGYSEQATKLVIGEGDLVGSAVTLYIDDVVLDTAYIGPIGPAGLSVTISPTTPTPITVGNGITFTATPSGGSTPYTYQWYLDGLAVSGATTVSATIKFNSAGTHPVYVIVKDATNATATSNTVTVTVNAFTVSISPTTASVAVGGSVTFTATPSGGTAPYTYQWYEPGGAVSGATSNPQALTFNASTTVYVIVNDSTGATATSASATVTVTGGGASQVIDYCESLTGWTSEYPDGSAGPTLALASDVHQGTYSVKLTTPYLLNQWWGYAIRSLTAGVDVTNWTGYTQLSFWVKPSVANEVDVTLGSIDTSGNWVESIYVLTGLTPNVWQNVIITLASPSSGSAPALTQMAQIRFDFEIDVNLSRVDEIDDIQIISGTTTTQTLTVSTTTGGTTDSSYPPGSYQLLQGSVVSVTAVPSNGYSFSNWNLDGANVGSSNPYSVTMTVGHTLQAVFTSNTITLTVVAGTGGNVSPSGTQTLTIGQTYAFTATANSGYAFTGWSGASTSTSNPLSLTITSAMNGQTLTANFTAGTYNLTVDSSPISGVPVTIDAATPTTITLNVVAGTGGSVSPSGTQTLTVGSTYAFTATAGSGYTFSSWSGVSTNTTNPLSLTITSAMDGQTLTANFTVQTQGTMSLHTSGANILDINNNVVHLRGIARCDFAGDSCTGIFEQNGTDIWSAGQTFTDQGVIDRITEMRSHGFNVMRMIFYVDWYAGNSKTGAFGTTNIGCKDAMVRVCQIAKTLGLYVVLSAYGDSVNGQTALPSGTATCATDTLFANFWKQVATDMVDTSGVKLDNVIFELWNEPAPNPGAQEAAWFVTAHTASTAIRTISNSLIALHDGYDTTDMGWVPTQATAWANAIGNVVYSAHFYRGSGATFSPSDPIDYPNGIKNTLFNNWNFGAVIDSATNTQKYPMWFGEAGCNKGTDETWYTNLFHTFNDWACSYAGWIWDRPDMMYPLQNSSTNLPFPLSAAGTILVNAISTGSAGVVSHLVASAAVSGTTPYTVSLAAGSHTVQVPAQVTSGGITYNFDHWEDNSTNTTRTINLTATTTITATYVAQVWTLTISVTPSGAGTTSPSGSVSVSAGSAQSVTATPYSGYVLSNWLLDGVSQNSSASTFTVPAQTTGTAHTLQAVFTQTITLNITAGTGGTVSPSGAQILIVGQSYQFTATANTGYKFDHWTLGTTTYTTNPLVLQATSAMNGQTLTAVFASTTITLSVVAGVNGTVSPSGTQTLVIGQSYQFAALANSGYQLDHWDLSGTSQGSSNPIALTATAVMNGQTLTALFTSIPPVQITMNIATSGNGTVNLSNGAHTFNVGDTPTFTATPASNNAFSQWTLNGTIYTTNPLLLQITSAMNGKTLTAVFVVSTITLNVIAGAGGTVSPSGSQTLTIGQTYTFTASPTTNYGFSGWALNGTNYSTNPLPLSITATMNGKTLTASFVQTTITLTVVAGTNGVVSPSGTQTLVIGQSYQFAALANSGYQLDHWDLSGVNQGSTNPIIITVTATMNGKILTALFTTIPVQQISMNIATIGNGSVNLANGSHTFNVGDSVQFTATPLTNNAFSQWTLNGTIYTANPVTVEITSGMNGQTLTAVFTLTAVTITVNTDGNGTVAPSGTMILIIGQQYLYSATPYAGFELDHWSLGGANIGSNNPVTIIATADMNGKTLTALFTTIPPVQITLSITIVGKGVTTPTAGSQIFNVGDSVQFTAIPNASYAFVEWKMNGTVYTDNPLMLTITEDMDKKTLTAEFTGPTPITSAILPAGIVILGVAGIVYYLATRKKR